MKEFALVAIVLAVLAVVAAIVVLIRYLQKKAGHTLSDAIGAHVRVTSRIDTSAGCGSVEWGGGEWSARSVSPEQTFDEGATVTVVAVEGVKLICR